MVGEAIKAIRKAKGLSQKDLAIACEIHVTTMSSIEKGGRYPTEEQRKRIAVVLEVPFELLAFLGLEPDNVKDSLKTDLSAVNESLTKIVLASL